MAAPSLRINQEQWNIAVLNDCAIILQPKNGVNQLEKVHRLFQVLSQKEIPGLIDFVPAYENLTLFWDPNIINRTKIIEQLAALEVEPTHSVPKTIHIKVDYNSGLDWDRVMDYTGFTRSEIIKKHSQTTYKVAMIGFLPGFIFLDGLDSELTVPRLDSPRNSVPAGSIGIGGSQTGMYSLPSAGGWNIIGTSTHQFFDAAKLPPINIMPGDFVKFVEID